MKLTAEKVKIGKKIYTKIHKIGKARNRESRGKRLFCFKNDETEKEENLD